METDRIRLAKQSFNEAWNLIDKQQRTKEEEVQMLLLAHASCYLWQEAQNPVNNSVGQWQVSHVYALLGHGKLALRFAEACLQTTLEGELGPFYLAFAYEAIARAYATQGRLEGMLQAQATGLSWCDKIPDPQDREYARKELLSMTQKEE